VNQPVKSFLGVDVPIPGLLDFLTVVALLSGILFLLGLLGLTSDRATGLPLKDRPGLNIFRMGTNVLGALGFASCIAVVGLF